MGNQIGFILQKILLLLILISMSFTLFANTLPVVEKLVRFQGNLRQPSAVAVDENGRVYVLDGTQNQVVVFSETGKKLFHFGEKGNTHLTHPMDISLFGDQLVIADTGSQRLMIYDTHGTFIKAISLKTPATDQLKSPVPVSVFMNQHYIYWGDRANHRVCKTNLTTTEIETCFGQRGEMEGEFQFPWQITTDSEGYLHVMDVLNARVQVFHPTGKFFSQISRFGLTQSQLYRPNGLVIGENKTLFVSDSYIGTVTLFSGHRFTTRLRMTDGSLLKFSVPVGLARHKNYLYIVDMQENTVYQATLVEVKENTLNIKDKATQFPQGSQKNCITCHLSWAKQKTSVKQRDSYEVLPVASNEMCYSCHHGVVLDSRLMIHHGDQHPTLYDPKEDKLTLKEMNARKDKMPKEFPLTSDKQMLCSSCHTPHNSDKEAQSLYKEHQNSWLRVSSKDGDLCERCHESKVKNARELNKKKRGTNHPLAIKFEPPPTKNQAGYATDPLLHKGLPISLKSSLANLGTKNQLICQSCHQIHGGKGTNLLAITQDNGKLCAQCHQKQDSKDKEAARVKGIHPVNVELEKSIKRRGEKITEVNCESCHKVHNGSLGTDLLPNYIKKTEGLCIDCHERQQAESEEEALKKGIHLTTKKLDEVVMVGNKKIHELGCLSCHSIHEGEPNTPALLEAYQKDELCENCHKKYFAKDIKTAIKKGLHPTHEKLEEMVKIGDNKIKVLGCRSCHSLHKGEKNTPALVQKYQKDELCKNCHKKYFAKNIEEAVKKGLHPTHEKLEEMVKIGDNEIKVLTCRSCHSIHEGEVETPALVNKYKQDELCKNCHEKYFAKDMEEAVEKGLHPTHETLDEPVTIGEHKIESLTCSSCHSIHEGEKNTPALVQKYNEDQLCKNCHKKYFAKNLKEAVKKGIHPTHLKLDEEVEIGDQKVKKLTCLGCHSIHQGQVKTPALLEAYNNDQLCKNCHENYFAEDKKSALKKGIHPMNHKLDKPVNIADKEVQKMGCLSCHGIHSGEQETPALLEKYKNGELCVNCHELKHSIVGTDHDLRITAKDKKNHFDELPKDSGVCGTCHTMHRGKGKYPHLFAVKIINETPNRKDTGNQQALKEDALCLNCHQQDGIAEKKGIEHYTHPYKDLILRSNPGIMPLLAKDESINEFGSIACITCHEPHLWEPLSINNNPKPSANLKNNEGTVKNSFLRRLGVIDTFCIDCHSIDALPKYKYYHHKDKVRNIGVDYLE